MAGQVLQKTNMEGGLPKKGRLGQFVDLGGGEGQIGKKAGMVFWRRLIPQCTL